MKLQMRTKKPGCGYHVVADP